MYHLLISFDFWDSLPSSTQVRNLSYVTSRLTFAALSNVRQTALVSDLIGLVLSISFFILFGDYAGFLNRTIMLLMFIWLVPIISFGGIVPIVLVHRELSKWDAHRKMLKQQKKKKE